MGSELKTFDVYVSADNWFYSAGITRDFGVNKIITLDSGDKVLCSVQPLRVAAVESGYLKKAGTIQVEQSP